MVKVRRLSHVAFETPDLEKSVDYYTQVNGLALVAKERGRAFLATKTGLLAIELEQGPKPRCQKLAFELAPATDFVEINRQLSNEGIASHERIEPAPGIPSVLSFLDPNGTSIELFSKWNYVDAPREVIGVGPLKLGHVAFFAPDPKLISDFYRSIMGFRVSDWIDDFFVFMRCNSDHHTVNFLRGDHARVHHIAFELKDVSHISNSCDLLARRQIRIVWGPLRFGPGHNIAAFHRNQDDQLVEFYTELDQMVDEELGYFDPRPWHRDTPQRPKIWKPAEDPIWGPPPPAGFM